MRRTGLHTGPLVDDNPRDVTGGSQNRRKRTLRARSYDTAVFMLVPSVSRRAQPLLSCAPLAARLRFDVMQGAVLFAELVRNQREMQHGQDVPGGQQRQRERTQDVRQPARERGWIAVCGLSRHGGQ